MDNLGPSYVKSLFQARMMARQLISGKVRIPRIPSLSPHPDVLTSKDILGAIYASLMQCSFLLSLGGLSNAYQSY